MKIFSIINNGLRVTTSNFAITCQIQIYSLLITESPGEQNISIVLNGIESELKFLTDDKGNKVRLVEYYWELFENTPSPVYTFSG